MVNQCVMCNAEMPTQEGHVCKECWDRVMAPKITSVCEIQTPPKPNTELSFGANDRQYDFLVYYCRAKPLNQFQIWMYKVCFGIRAKNI